MSSEASRPGKLGPYLCSNFLIFDPTKPAKPSNILVDHPPPSGEGPQIAPPIGSCKHEYTIKINQSTPPPLDLRPTGDSQYKLAVICKKCRIHADLQIDHSNSENPCPASSHPLHHFQTVSSLELATADRIRYVWRCSIAECRATLFIHFRKPRLHENELHALVDPESLKRRYDELMQENPDREGIRTATPVEALSRLRRYVTDALNPDHTKRQFPSHNKRFQEAFGIDGRDCLKLLMRLGFKYDDHTWILPDPEQISDRLQAHGDSLRELLEDAELELLAYQFKLAVEQSAPAPAEGSWPSANGDIERMFGAQGWTRHVSQRRAPVSNTELAYFNGLGALPEFSDNLVEYAFDRQTLCDPERQAYYFECLQEITDSRQTEQLQTKVATLASQDVVSRRDVFAAYRYFSIPTSESKNCDDSRILDAFHARQSDQGPAAQEQAREHLYKIGVSRQSTLLINAARQSVETYEDALSWLGNGVNKDTADDVLLSVLTVKTDGSPGNEEIGQKAISVIAKARKSQLLNNWLLTGKTDGYTMTVDEALRHLGYEQSLSNLDKEWAKAIFANAREDRPGETTNKAIAIVWQALTEGENMNSQRSPETWPVGLTSHGNTCYLNSLLQYYFSIKPLRDIVLNYDDYKLDTSTQIDKDARVGQRKVTMIEIKGGQRFAEDMKQLFERMIKSRDSAVKPEEDLVCRAFLDPTQYRLLDPNYKSDRPDSTDQKMSNGVDGASEKTLSDGEMLASPIETMTEEVHSSEASSTTLQASVNGEDGDVSMKDAGMPPTPPASPGLKGGGQEISHPTYGPPPLPPRRRFSTTKEEALALAKQKAKEQQDVTEVHDAAMWRLRCGMTPGGSDEDEEQTDELRDLFSVLFEQTIINGGNEQKPKHVHDSNIQLDVPHETTHIYEALDAYFDRQPYGDNTSIETFKSLKALPPLLQINIPRIGYDDTGAYKSNECVRLEDEIYLDRYFGHDHPHILAKRRQCWLWRKRLQWLKMEQKVISKTAIDNVNGSTVLSETAAYLASLDEVNKDLEESIGIPGIDADGDITDALMAESQKQAAAVAAYQSEIDDLQRRLDAEFAGPEFNSIKYRLAAVFFHRGQYGHGHYWVYIHDFVNNIWRIYNDERVDEFTKMNEIFEAKTFNDGTPTYAVYVDADKLDLVEPVCRQLDDHMQEIATIETVDPTNLVKEGGETGWDAPREVASTNW